MADLFYFIYVNYYVCFTLFTRSILFILCKQRWVITNHIKKCKTPLYLRVEKFELKYAYTRYTDTIGYTIILTVKILFYRCKFKIIS